MISIILFRMGHSKDEKAASHERIVEVAAAQIRERGTEQPGVSEIMRAAGLTHGGFYKHFSSREQLITEAVGHALTENEPVVEQMLSSATDPLAAFVDWYVSSDHRDDPAHGCGLAALGTDVGRLGEDARDAYRAQLERYLDRLQELLGDGAPDARARAAVAVSAMVGSVMLARALGPTELSERLLADVRTAVHQLEI
jgi:TetR/AcrR family transcriptional regulator, transcriptional repressor for nem operon